MATQVQVSKAANENDMNVLRRFTKLFRATGIQKEVKARRYYSRGQSALKNKRSALRRLELTVKYDKLRKLGKIS
jgi:ribosomal protein S21